MAAAVSIRDLSKRYAGIPAVAEVGFEVREGSIFGLIGPNGAGKTTTLECILGLTSPDSGVIAVMGEDIRTHPHRARQILGAQLQGSTLPESMTPRQALTLCASFYSRAAAPSELIRRFGLAGKADARFGSLSGGLKQRLSLALAFVNRPRVVVLDEPTAGLDPASRSDLHGLISEQRDLGATIVFTTHYLEEARALCDQVALMDRGRIAAIGAPESLISASGARPRIVARLGRPLPEEFLQSIEGVVRVSRMGAAVDACFFALETLAVGRSLVALAALAERSGVEIVTLQVEHPTLDDVFESVVRARAAEAALG